MSTEDERRPPQEPPSTESARGERTDDDNLGSPPPVVNREGGDDGDPLARLLSALFDGTGGLIETRVIEDRKGGSLVDRRWHGSAEDLRADQVRLLSLSEAKRAGTFFGVLPRRAVGVGTAADVLAGHVAWVDIDFRDFPGGEAEARKRLAEFPVPPSAVVRSGHGLHGYWLLRELEEPETLSRLSEGLAQALGGDHAFDAARILRLPGTVNWKDPEHPVPVEIEFLDEGRACNRSEIEEAIAAYAPKPEARASARSAGTEGAARIDGPLDPQILAMIDRKVRIRTLFEGTGKPELDKDGRRLDTTSSGYDFSVALALCKAGIVDPVILGNALWNRPDEAAKAKGLDYINRTVEKVLERFEEFQKDDDDVEIDFVVEGVRVFASVPPVHELTIAGKSLTLKTPELLSRDSFTVAFVNVHRRVPTLPKRWADQVNVWLAQAELVEQPPEASDEHALREAVLRVIDDMPVGEESKDLDHGKALVFECGTKAFRVEALLKLLHDDWPHVRRNELCRVLREVGFDSSPRKVGADRVQVRVWHRKGAS